MKDTENHSQKIIHVLLFMVLEPSWLFDFFYLCSRWYKITMGEEGASKKETKAVVDTSSPYYLHPSDHPRMNICLVIWKGENYQEWERCVRNTFRANRKLVFLDGIITKPDDGAPEIEDWWSVNSMLLAWLFNSIEPTLRSSISYFDTVKELWDDLRQRFAISNGPRI